MKKLLLGLVVLPLMVSVSTVYAETMSAPAPATTTTTSSTDDSVLRADHPQTYTVVKGDTLWDISGRFLSKPWMWKQLWHMNPNIKNPDLIYPGDIIKLVYINGKPMLTVDRGAVANNSGTQDCMNQPTQKTMPDGVVKMSPKCRAIPAESAIPAISLEAIAPFLSENRVVTSDDQLKSAPHVIASERVSGGQGDTMFARGHFDESSPIYDIYRVGKTYADPITSEQLGLVLRNIGRAKVLSPKEEVSKIELIKTNQEVLVEDKLIPSEETKLASYFLPQTPEKAVNGYILDVLGGVSQVGQYNIVLLSKGERDGLHPGTVMAIYHDSGTVQDPSTNEMIKLPTSKAGLLMVFRAFEKLSYAIVLQADRPLALMDEFKNP